MDPEKSSNSSFEDLSNINENDLKETIETKSEQEHVIDIIGNGQLVKKILKEGDPNKQPERGDICKINILGTLENGTVVEDIKQMSIQVGDLEVIQGLDMAISLMRLGETAEVSVDPRFAYGSIGLKNDENDALSIPPNSKITYKIELLDIKDEGLLETLSYDDRKKVGDRKRERGNFWYSRNEYNMAIQLYRKALEFLDESGVMNANDAEITNSQLQELLDIRVKVYNNLAAAQMKISAFDVALASVDNVLRCQPENVKALFRKAKILEAKGDINNAIPIVQKAAILDPESRAIQQLLSKCIFKSRRDARNEKDLYQKMLGHAQKIEEKSKSKTKRESKDDTKMKLWTYLLGSILIGVAGVAMYRYKYF